MTLMDQRLAELPGATWREKHSRMVKSQVGDLLGNRRLQSERRRLVEGGNPAALQRIEVIERELEELDGLRFGGCMAIMALLRHMAREGEAMLQHVSVAGDQHDAL